MSEGEGLSVLVVEDEAILALEIEFVLRELGHTVAGVAMDSARAQAVVESRRVDLALVDINLRDGATGPELCRRLVADHGTAVIFLTANPEQIPDGFAGALGAMPKPFDDRAIRDLVVFASSVIRDRRVPPAPRRFRMAPWLLTPPNEIKPH